MIVFLLNGRQSIDMKPLQKKRFFNLMLTPARTMDI